ncbi:hypothetical protein Poli38472_008482 [Pythium oligandrum]|uniref:DNA polymerase n=1 Tax=Pythium oligandrum TaxID=41045 RepID=A0A8K1C3N0_PYTOL|nr:hypothetical protein Poli38472_008482 [Pythium oligandrum]|eukprot:TMW55834.1 hypothetical protein Poli38472_008482 [Pythium oligandrum]
MTDDEEEEEFCMETVVVDYYMSAPLPDDALYKLPVSPCYRLARQVPVMRVFGATPAGQKACLHIHGLFPYFYFRAENDPVFDDVEQLKKLLPRIAMELEKANELKQKQAKKTTNEESTSTQGNGQRQGRSRRSTTSKLVAKLLIVQGMPFYGYHDTPRLFVQIFLYNPRAVASTVQLLESGCIAERRFQPYEAHVPFLLQVFADYHIEGMNHIHLSHVKFRAPLPAVQDHLKRDCVEGEQLPVYLRSNVPSSKIHGDVAMFAQVVKGRSVRVPGAPVQWFDRHSSSVLEVDVAAECIMNPRLFTKLQKSLVGTSELRSVPSLAALWEEERLRRIQNGEQGTPEFSLSVERKMDRTPEPTGLSAAQSASSLLSQSFFQQKMQDAVATIMEQFEKEKLEQSHSSIDEVSREETRTQFSQQCSSNEIAHSRSTIMTESEYSFSQNQLYDGRMHADDSATDEAEEQKEDEDIVNLLLAMQQEPRSNLASDLTVNTRPGYHGEDAFTDDEIDRDEENEIGMRAEELEDIGDILASQRLFEDELTERTTSNRGGKADRERETKNSWWNVGDNEQLSASSGVLDIGSPRLEWSEGQQHRKRQESSLKRKKRLQYDSEQGEGDEEDEEVEYVLDIEDLLPPQPPPVRMRRQREEEESVPLDPSLLSPTPNFRRIVRKIPKPPSLQEQVKGRPKVWLFDPPPPSMSDLLVSSRLLGVGEMEHQAAYYSNADDIPEKPLVFGGKKFEFTPTDLTHIPRFDTLQSRAMRNGKNELPSWSTLDSLKSHQPPHLFATVNKIQRVRIPATSPPTYGDVEAWLIEEKGTISVDYQRRTKKPRHDPLTTSLEARKLHSSATSSNLTILSLEIHANSRSNLLPDPHRDRVELIAYAVEAQEGPTAEKTKERGIIIVKSTEAQPEGYGGMGPMGFCVDNSELCVAIVESEHELLTRLEELVHRWDPDFLVGFEVQKESIGYLVDRSSQLKMNLVQMMSRLPTTQVDARNTSALLGPDEIEEGNGEVSIGTTWGVTKASGLWVHGRQILNLWRLARSEIKLSRYAWEDVLRAVMKREFPVYSAEQLTTWYVAGGQLRWKVVRYVLDKATLNLKLLSRMQLVTRTSEMARLFGMDFYSVLSRGSQYRVESVMLRVTKRHNYIMVSPNRTQVARQAPMECIPLVMEPLSTFYSDPVVVLDFQSLYPSLVIGYNLCYSTLYGRLKSGLKPELEAELGVVDFTPSSSGLLQDRDNLIISPSGTLYSSKVNRLGVLPVILDEILATRIMVKNAMKKAKERGQERLEKVLNARQLALKLLANVTYGYTAAGFSGRMPCAQLADSIVQSGRCTLEAAVRLVEGNREWNAKIVYGDTDSLFVLLRGRSKQQAFRIGQEIADVVTASNPKPVTLKLEKVYMGSILVSKKRYVGLKFENPNQAVGAIESKGIEIVRRDSCGVVQKSMQSCLELLFATSDLSQVRQALEQYWTRMLEDSLPMKDFIFAKEVRLGTYARGSAPPAALVSAKAMAKDPRAEPRYAERVQYVVINGPPGARLVDLVVSPFDLTNRSKRRSINYQYYIHKQIIPSLERLFLLMGANASHGCVIGVQMTPSAVSLYCKSSQQEEIKSWKYYGWCARLVATAIP